MRVCRGAIKLLVLIMTFFMLFSQECIVVAEKGSSLSVWLPAPEEVIDINTNEFVMWAEEQTGTQIEFLVVDSQSVDEQLNLLLSSGVKLPDIIMTDFNSAQLIQYGSEGILIPLNDLLDEHGKNAQYFVNAMTGSDDFAPITAPDGNIYSMPTGEACYHCSFSQKMWINKTWLEQLGLSTPTTIDEFYNVLIAFRDMDGLPPVFVPTSELVKTVSWHPHSFIGLATS